MINSEKLEARTKHNTSNHNNSIIKLTVLIIFFKTSYLICKTTYNNTPLKNLAMYN